MQVLWAYAPLAACCGLSDLIVAACTIYCDVVPYVWHDLASCQDLELFCNLVCQGCATDAVKLDAE